MINVYGPTKIEGKVRVWKELSERIRIIGKVWLVVAGDFNAILDLNEKKWWSEEDQQNNGRL